MAMELDSTGVTTHAHDSDVEDQSRGRGPLGLSKKAQQCHLQSMTATHEH